MLLLVIWGNFDKQEKLFVPSPPYVPKYHFVAGLCEYIVHFAEVKYQLKGFVAERKGEREDMQDAHVIIDDYLPEIDNPPENM